LRKVNLKGWGESSHNFGAKTVQAIILYLMLLVVPPSIAIEGPESADVNSVVIINIDVVGQDLKFDCNPKNDNWKVVKFLDNNKTGIVFFPKEEGQYTFSIASNNENKTALSTYSVTVGSSPNPGPVDGLKSTLAKSIKDDKATKEQVQSLAKFYKNATRDLVPKAKDIQELLTEMRKIAPDPNILRATRKSLDTYFQNKLPKQNIVLTRIVRDNFVNEFEKVATTLEQLSR